MNLASLFQPQGQQQAQSPQGLASLLTQPSPAPGGQVAPPMSTPPAPTHEQTVAAYHRFQETKRLMGRILQNPKTGHENIRPLVLDAGAILIGERVQSLAEFMSGISKFPPSDDPLGQKKWVERLFAVSSQAQRKILQDHRAANAPDYQQGVPWSADNHNDNFAGLMTHYRS
jgi:hypothetical protein